MSDVSTSPVPSVQLEECVAEGGMSRVWRGRRDETDSPVAVKLAYEPARPDTDRDQSFVREVQSEARLAHPGIVDVLDYGYTQAAFSAPGGEEQRPPDLPYIVMEYARGGTLATDERIRNWANLRETLRQILDALAYAHARGVVHRDIKPRNVLVRESSISEEDRAPTYLLTDFGIAHALASGEGLRTGEVLAVSAGTPAYMAPEQLEERWRDFGPWTDLYALGCLAYALASGQPPFDGGRPVEIAKQQLDAPPPTLTPRFPIPAQFRDWLGVLLRKPTRARFQRAADAAAALGELPVEPDGRDWTGIETEPIAPADAETLDGDVLSETRPANGLSETATGMGGAGTKQGIASAPGMTETLTGSSIAGTPDSGDLSQVEASGEAGDGGTFSSEIRPSVPDDWRPDRRRQPARPSGLSLDLFALREVPFVDRESHRDRLWESFRAAVESGRPGSVLLDGPTGTGKSRLARWLCERAHEVGAAIPLRAGRTSGVQRAGGLAELLESYFRTWNLGRERTHARIREHLLALVGGETDGERSFVDGDAQALTELLWPSDPEADGPGFDFSSRSERFAVLRRFLRQVASDRPLVIWIDDAHRLPRTLEFATDLSQRGDCPILTVATVNDDELSAEDDLDRRLGEFREVSETLRVDPLDRADHRRLVDRMLDLDESLLDRVAERTSGNPLFAFQLLENWIQRGVLRRRDGGHELAADVRAALPSDIYESCTRRLDLLADRYADDEREDVYAALELAAALGGEIESDEWTHACELADIEIPQGLVGELVRRGLARHTREGWRFAHPLLRETLEKLAREDGRWSELHDVCADMLEERAGDRPGIDSRLARHLVASERLDEAADALLSAARTHKAAAEFEEALDRLDRHAAVLDASGVADADRRRAREKLERIGVWKARGWEKRVMEAAESLRPQAEREGWDDLLVEIYRTIAVGRLHAGRREDARRSLQTCRELAEDVGDERELGYTHRYEATVELQEGRPGRALDLLERAEESFRRAGDEARVATVYEKIGYVHMQTGRLDRAASRIRQSLDLLRNSDVHRPIRIASALNAIGDTARLRNRYGRALEYYDEAHRIFERADMPRYAATVELNTGLCSLGRGSLGDARSALESAGSAFAGADAAPKRIIAELGLVACAVDEGDDDRARQLLEGAREWLDERDFVDRDVAEASGASAEIAADRGDPEIADALYTVAQSQWERLDRPRRRDQVQTKRQQLQTESKR